MALPACRPLELHTGSLSLFVDAALPFFIDPIYQKSYGFNTFVALDAATTINDGCPHTCQQSELRSGEAFQLTATVNGAIRRHDDPTMSERFDNQWWADVYTRLGPDYDEGVFNEFFGAHVGLLTDWNNQTEIYLARWDTTLNESSNSTVQRSFCVRAQYTGVWNVESSIVLW